MARPLPHLAPLLLAACLLASGPTPAARADLEAGRRAFAAGDLAGAYAAFARSADSGDPAGQFLVGQMLLQGRGVPKDATAGLAWLEKAAASGHVGAMSTAGTLYAFGEEVPADYAKALALLVPAAEAGDANAQNNAATLYYFGLGTPKDLTKALHWALRAERQNVVTAIRLRSEIEAEASPAMKAEAMRLVAQPLKGPPKPTAVAQAESKPVVAATVQAPATPAAEQPTPAAAAPSGPQAEPLAPMTGPAPSATGQGGPRPEPAPPQVAARPAPTPVPRPTSATAPAGWAVQLAALPSRAEADKEWLSQKRRLSAVLGGREASLVEVDLGPKGVFTRILLGGLPDKAAAEALCGEVKAAGGDCLIRKP